MKDLRCRFTQNPCGTDTWTPRSPCRCDNCQAWLCDRLESLRAQLAEYRAAITALDCWMEKHDPKARSDYWRWRHRYHAIVNDARGDHE